MDDRGQLNAEFLKGRRVCAAGRLASMTRGELAELVTACGGEFLTHPRRTGFLLVMGDGAARSLSQTLVRARRLQAYGYPIELIAEEDFLDRLGLTNSASAIRGPHTLSDLSRILEVPIVQLRRWLQAGLLRPVATQYSLPYFDYHQVSFIKHLKELIDGGASLAAIRRGVERTRDLLPHAHSLYEYWSNIEQDGRVLLRLADQLVDQSGQQYFDFEPQSEESATVYAAPIESGFHDLCDQALILEAEGRLVEARQAYERAIELQPDHPTLHFDLGNVLFQQKQVPAAIAAFQRATQLDGDFAMAWHNLGSVFAHQGNWQQAVPALLRALELVPTYADSHFTLAQVFRAQGRLREAAEHEQAYHKHSKAEILLTKRESFLRLVTAED